MNEFVDFVTFLRPAERKGRYTHFGTLRSRQAVAYPLSETRRSKPDFVHGVSFIVSQSLSGQLIRMGHASYPS